VDSIPTSANKEDHVSMGVAASLKLQQIVQNTTSVLAIELLCTAQALDILSPKKTSNALQKAHQMIRAAVPRMERDRVIAEDIVSVTRMMEKATFLSEIELLLGHSL
jgi:histidine ammonia-lyase